MPRSHRACLAVSVSLGLSVLVPRLASRVTVAVRADARDVVSTYLSTYLPRPHTDWAVGSEQSSVPGVQLCTGPVGAPPQEQRPPSRRTSAPARPSPAPPAGPLRRRHGHPGRGPLPQRAGQALQAHRKERQRQRHHEAECVVPGPPPQAPADRAARAETCRSTSAADLKPRKSRQPHQVWQRLTIVAPYPMLCFTSRRQAKSSCADDGRKLSTSA